MTSSPATTSPPRLRYGVEPFDVGHGGAFTAEPEAELDLECPLVEGAGALERLRPAARTSPERVAFIDGVMRVEARLVRAPRDAAPDTGIAGWWAAGALLAPTGRPLGFGPTRSERVSIMAGAEPLPLPEQSTGSHGPGWRWTPLAVDSAEPDAARKALLAAMRAAEGEIAEHLASKGWTCVVDGPLNHVRRSLRIPLVGYIKTHRRRMLALEHWTRVPELGVGERTSAFAMGEHHYACYFRVGPSGPWASPWAGIVRLEVPAGLGRQAGVEALDRAAGLLPRYASAPHRDPRAPVNLTPIAGLERTLKRRAGDARLALRAVRAAVLQLARAPEERRHG